MQQIARQQPSACDLMDRRLLTLGPRSRPPVSGIDLPGGGSGAVGGTTWLERKASPGSAADGRRDGPRSQPAGGRRPGSLHAGGCGFSVVAARQGGAVVDEAQRPVASAAHRGRHRRAPGGDARIFGVFAEGVSKAPGDGFALCARGFGAAPHAAVFAAAFAAAGWDPARIAGPRLVSGRPQRGRDDQRRARRRPRADFVHPLAVRAVVQGLPADQGYFRSAQLASTPARSSATMPTSPPRIFARPPRRRRSSSNCN